jgi:hypothetical protein
MPLPSYVVELQFGSSSYVDVTSYVQSISIDRGISRQLEDYSAGSLSITFVNNDRTFDPLNTSSILWYGAGSYTMVQPGGRVRVSTNGVRRFTGFIQNWDLTYDQSGFDGQARVSALDEMYRVGNAVFTGGTQAIVESTSDRIKRVFNYNGFSASEYAGVQSGQTPVGGDVNNAGDNVLSYLQNVARSEPADFYSNASAVMVMKDRSFTNYTWTNTTRQNLIKYPNPASFDTTSPAVTGGTGLGDGWVYGGRYISTISPIYGGTVNRADVVTTTRDFWYQEVNQNKINPDGTATKYVYSVWLRGSGLTGAGVTSSFLLLDSSANTLVSSSGFASSGSTATWVNIQGTASYVGAGTVAGFSWNVSAPGTAVAYDFFANGWQVEAGTVISDYFDGTLNPYTSNATTRYDVGWTDTQYASSSGMLISSASTASAPTVLTFADQNSQGASYGNGTGIPFGDLSIVYGSENLYNKVQVVGVNATAIATDSSSRYDLKAYTQTDNLTTSVVAPTRIASGLLAEYRLPEYRADKITIYLEALTNAQQTLVLGLEIRDVIRVCFQPSITGSVIDKYYQILGINSNSDVERDHITLNVASLDNLPIRLDSTFLAILDTDTLG